MSELFSGKTELQPKFQVALKDPENVVEVQVIMVMDSQFWLRECRRLKYREQTC